MHNYLYVLKWLSRIDRDFYELKLHETEICSWDEHVCDIAIEYEYIDILKFALEKWL